MTKIAKYAPGAYTVYDLSDPVLKVDVCYFSKKWDDANFTGWVARAEWTNDTYTDPLPTKREAVEEAKAMITDRKERA